MIIYPDELVSDEISHHGVKGMKWGVRNDKKRGSASGSGGGGGGGGTAEEEDESVEVKKDGTEYKLDSNAPVGTGKFVKVDGKDHYAKKTSDGWKVLGPVNPKQKKEKQPLFDKTEKKTQTRTDKIGGKLNINKKTTVKYKQGRVNESIDKGTAWIKKQFKK